MISQNETNLVADALNGVGMLIDYDDSYIDLLCGDHGALLDCAVIGRDKQGRVILTGSRVASGLEHEVYDAIRLERLDEKWQVDGAELLTRLRAMTPEQRRELITRIADAWDHCSDHARFDAELTRPWPAAAPARRLDGFLSRKAQKNSPGAMVYCAGEKPHETWTIERAGYEPLGIGKSFHEAHQAVMALNKK